MKRFLAIYTGTPAGMADWNSLPERERKEREVAGRADRVKSAYLGAILIDPSSRITSPLRYSLPMIWATSEANSAGRPSRGGKGTILPSDSAYSGGT